jgi:cystathionine gamma-synthase
MNELIDCPLWQKDSLGTPLPNNRFGVSVSLPLWEHVIGYEEGDPAVLEKFQSGYPRFFSPPVVTQLFSAAQAELAEASGERCLVFPRLSHAQRCVAFLEKRGLAGRALAWRLGTGVALFSEQAHATARQFWRFCGEIVSTRQADAVLASQDVTLECRERGTAASGQIQQRLAELNGQLAEDVFLFPSGMAANFALHRMLVSLFPGAKTVQLDFPYTDVLKLQQQFGAGAHFLPMMDEGDYAVLVERLKEEPLAGLFCEAPSNPLLRCVDLQRVVAARNAWAPRVPLIVDDTIATPVNAETMKVADVVTSSLTKSFSGTGDVLAGALTLNRASPHHAVFQAFLEQHADHELWWEDAVALERNSRDVVPRVQKMSANASALAAFLRGHPAVEKVWYAEGQAGYECIRRAGGGYGCLLSFLLKDAERLSPLFYDRLQVCKGPSLGTNFTLVCPYTLLAHYDELEWAASCGVPSHLIRVSAGLETDLVQRFAEALDSLIV